MKLHADYLLDVLRLLNQAHAIANRHKDSKIVKLLEHATIVVINHLYDLLAEQGAAGLD